MADKSLRSLKEIVKLKCEALGKIRDLYDFKCDEHTKPLYFDPYAENREYVISNIIRKLEEDLKELGD